MPGISHMYTQALSVASFTGPKEPLGTIRREGTKTFRYVKFVKGAAALTVVLGDIVRYVNAAGYDLSEVTADATAADIGAGVSMVAVTITTAQMDATAGVHGWIQITGAALISQTLATTVGDGLTNVGAGDRTLVVATATGKQVATTLATGAGTSRILCDFTQ